MGYSIRGDSMKNERIERTHSDLILRFKEQYGFLLRSNEAYDRGYEDEAKRIALVLRILFHDSKKNKRCISVLTQLGIKDKIEFLDTASEYDEKNLLTFSGLTYQSFSIDNSRRASTSYKPIFDPPWGEKLCSYESWWNQIVIKNKFNNLFVRKDIVLNVSDTDGGAHVDANLDVDYAK